MIRVGVFGAGGKMGATVCRAVEEDPATVLVAAVDPHHGGIELAKVAGIAGSTMQVTTSPSSFVDAGVQVAIDFTEAAAARNNVLWCAEHGIHAVVGTTGFSEKDLYDFQEACTSSNIIVAPNFAIGAVLMMRFAEMAAQYFDTAEIIEYHHEMKKDAPSGTATLTAQRIAEASDSWVDDPTEAEVLVGARGGEGPAGVRVHSIRMRGMVAHQEVLFGAMGQTLTIRHDSIDRTSFMPGVLLATKRISQMPGFTVGLDAALGW